MGAVFSEYTGTDDMLSEHTDTAELLSEHTGAVVMLPENTSTADILTDTSTVLYESTENNIPPQFRNVFGFIDYKADGSVPWTPIDNIFLSKEYEMATDFLAIDCEMVGVGNFKISVLGRVSIVNEYGFCVYDKFVNPLEKVTDYNTQFSGIRAEDLADGKVFSPLTWNPGCILK